MTWRLHKGDLFERENHPEAAQGQSMGCPGCGSIITDEARPPGPPPGPPELWTNHNILFCKDCSLWAMIGKEAGLEDGVCHPRDKPCGFCIMEWDRRGLLARA